MRDVDAALAAVPVASFAVGAVPADDQAPFAIGSGQRGTPPDTVRRLVLEAGVVAGQRVLELGSGSGYTAAVLAALGAEVHGVERQPELVERATTVLETLGSSARVHRGDALLGWPEAAPYDVILATVAVRTLPPAWLRQLADDGILVAPMGPPDGPQELTRFRREHGRLQRQGRGPCRFVAISPAT